MSRGADSALFDQMSDMSTSYSASDYISRPEHHFKSDDECDKYDSDAPFQLRRPPLATLPTPPDSPTRQAASTASFNLHPFLQRASTVMNRRRGGAQELATPPASRGNSPQRRGHKAGMSVASFADMFSGSSAPMSLGLLPSPKKELSAAEAELGRSESPDTSRRGNSFAGAASFFGLSRTNLTNQGRARQIDEADAEDPYLNLDLEDELFPKGVPGAEAPSADAYDELVANASRLFLRMQTAYEKKHRSLREFQASKTFEQEELEEARTRAKHLKLQLDGMSAVVAEQSESMKDLEKQLNDERNRRRLETQMSQNSIRLISHEKKVLSGYGTDMSAIDLGQIDLHGDSDNESQAESVFSSRSKAASTRSNDTRTEEAARAEDLAPWIAPIESAEELKEENVMLKARVQELEETVNACLGLV